MIKRTKWPRVAALHPEVKVEVHDDSEEGGNKTWEKLADKWNIKGVPVLIWVAGGEELFRSFDVSAKSIEAQYAKALKRAGL